jgi:hypothetical protein
MTLSEAFLLAWAVIATILYLRADYVGSLNNRSALEGLIYAKETLAHWHALIEKAADGEGEFKRRGDTIKFEEKNPS